MISMIQQRGTRNEEGLKRSNESQYPKRQRQKRLSHDVYRLIISVANVLFIIYLFRQRTNETLPVTMEQVHSTSQHWKYWSTLEMLIFVSLLINNVLPMMSRSSACPFSNGVSDVVAVSNVSIHTLDSVKERSSSYSTIAVFRTKSNLRKKVKYIWNGRTKQDAKYMR